MQQWGSAIKKINLLCLGTFPLYQQMEEDTRKYRRVGPVQEQNKFKRLFKQQVMLQLASGQWPPPHSLAVNVVVVKKRALWGGTHFPHILILK